MINRVIIKPTRPAGPPIRFNLVGEDTLKGGVGGWDSLQRPRREAAVEWLGTPATTYVLPLLIDGVETRPGRNTVVEATIRELESWGRRAKESGQPPVLQVAGPVRVSPASRWVLNDIEWGTQIRNTGGRRIQQAVTLTLLKYVETTILRGPAAASRNRRR